MRNGPAAMTAGPFGFYFQYIALRVIAAKVLRRDDPT
jgi:hypothetical protein